MNQRGAVELPVPAAHPHRRVSFHFAVRNVELPPPFAPFRTRSVLALSLTAERVVLLRAFIFRTDSEGGFVV